MLSVPTTSSKTPAIATIETATSVISIHISFGEIETSPAEAIESGIDTSHHLMRWRVTMTLLPS